MHKSLATSAEEVSDDIARAELERMLPPEPEGQQAQQQQQQQVLPLGQEAPLEAPSARQLAAIRRSAPGYSRQSAAAGRAGDHRRGYGNMPRRVAAVWDRVASMFRSAIEVVAILLDTAPDLNAGGAVASCLLMVHANPGRALRLAERASCGGLGHARRERLAALLSEPYPVPSNERYLGFIDPEGLECEGQHSLSRILQVGEERIRDTAPQLWRRILRERLHYAKELAEDLRIIADQIEEEYNGAHAALVPQKLELDRRQAAAAACAEQLKTCTPTDFALISLAVHTGEAPKTVYYCAAAAYATLAPLSLTISEDPKWDVVGKAVFRDGGTAFESRIYHPVSTMHVSDDRRELLSTLLGKVSAEAVRDAGCRALDALYAWCCGARGYLAQLADMQVNQDMVRAHAPDVEELDLHRELSDIRLQRLTEAYYPGALGQPRRRAPADPVPVVTGAAENMAQFIRGWGTHDVSAVPLTEDQLRRLFNRCDTDNSGAIEVSELRKFYGLLEHYGVEETERRIEQLIRGRGLLRDGRVTFDEFAMLMLNITAR